MKETIALCFAAMMAGVIMRLQWDGAYNEKRPERL